VKNNTYDDVSKSILSKLSQRDKDHYNATRDIYKSFDHLIISYEMDIIRKLRLRLYKANLSFDEFTKRFNSLYGCYHVLYEERWRRDEDGYEWREDEFISEEFKGFYYAIRQHAKKYIKEDYPDLVFELFDIGTIHGDVDYPYDDAKAASQYLFIDDRRIVIKKESQRGSS
jgi:hypothetical protein